tara:strand:+ start:463 stop:714 length:252 start_codon:yes stop_codon:yes gene_type:complete
MSYIVKLIKDLIKLTPYFIIILIYFFLVNIEAKKQKIEQKNTMDRKFSYEDKVEKIDKDQSSNENIITIRKSIKVIPYESLKN